MVPCDYWAMVFSRAWREACVMFRIETSGKFVVATALALAPVIAVAIWGEEDELYNEALILAAISAAAVFCFMSYFLSRLRKVPSEIYSEQVVAQKSAYQELSSLRSEIQPKLQIAKPRCEIITDRPKDIRKYYLEVINEGLAGPIEECKIFVRVKDMNGRDMWGGEKLLDLGPDILTESFSIPPKKKEKFLVIFESGSRFHFKIKNHTLSLANTNKGIIEINIYNKSSGPAATSWKFGYKRGGLWVKEWRAESS